ncbi:MAG: protein-glutamate O-methyltransferase [Clostridiales bacterium]|nr:protein-glutamate O-methyltransferase [Clostridiales bacterium]
MENISDAEFERIRTYIKQKLGISLSDGKKSLIYSRLRSIIKEKDMTNFTEYFNYLIKDKSGEGITQFIDKVTTNHTYFMREPEHFDYLKTVVLPYILGSQKIARELRLWCAGCSSGEEAYALQMSINDFLKMRPDKWIAKQWATDISTQVLDKAKEGVYPKKSVAALPTWWLNEYCVKVDTDNYKISDNIKKQITFQKYNLMDFRVPFHTRMQIIFCRNVMIYFDPSTREKVVDTFYNATEPGGYLFIGHSESLSHIKTKYRCIKPSVYRKDL